MSPNTPVQPIPRKEGEIFTSKRPTPARRYIDSLDGEYYLLSEAAAMVGISQQTLRRLIRRADKTVRAPSYKGHQGKMEIYIFSAEDIEELKEYYSTKYVDFTGTESRGPGRPRSKKD